MLTPTMLCATGRMASMSIGARATAPAATRAMASSATSRLNATRPILATPLPETAAAAPGRKTTRTISASKAKTKAATKPKAKKVEKLKAWEARGSDGKLLPLPAASKPKRPTIYTIFTKDRVADYRNDPSFITKNKDGKDVINIIEVTKKIGEEWKSLASEQRQKFEDEFRRQLAQYEREMEQWREALTSEDIRRQNAYNASLRKKGKQARNLRDPTKPVRPQTAYFLYLQDMRKDASVAGLPTTELVRKVADMYNSLSASVKQTYEERARQAKEKYEKEMQEFKRQTNL